MSKYMKLGELVSHKKGNAFKSKDYQTSGKAIVRVSDFEGDSINLDNLYYVSEKVAEENKSVALKKYDVVVTTVGASAGNFIRVPVRADGFLLNQNAVRLRVLSENIWDQIYLFYALKHKNFKEYLLSGAQGSAQPSIVLDQILNTEIIYGSNSVREKIAKILFAFDEKIQLNTQINQTLEQIAQTIFKSWFIDFDPVRAKAAAFSDGNSPEQATLAAMQTISGKTEAELTAYQTEHPEAYQQLHQLAQTFPSEFEEIDGVEVPKGWEMPYLKDVCSIVYGKGLPKTKLLSEGYDVFGANGVIGYYSEYMYEKPQVLVGCRGTVGQVTISLPYSFVTNNSLVIEYENSPFCLSYLEQYLKTINLKEVSSGSVQPQITIQNMSGVKILKPSEDILKFFDSKVEYIYELKLRNYFQNKTLSEARDLLLPKLLSGEVSYESK